MEPVTTGKSTEDTARLSRRISSTLSIGAMVPLAVACGILGVRLHAWTLVLVVFAAGAICMALLARFLTRRILADGRDSGRILRHDGIQDPDKRSPGFEELGARNPVEGADTDARPRAGEEIGFRRARIGSIAELAGGIAHEINNPVAIMVEEAGWIEDLLDEEDLQQSENLEEFKRALKQIKTQGSRCKEITRNLLSFARKSDPRVKDLQLNDLLREVVQSSQKRLAHGNIRIRASLAEGLPSLRVSPAEMQQVFMNLVNNAVDALDPRGGTVEVASRLEGEEILVDVSDNGPGIPEADLSRIFEPFFTTKPVGKGTGLGLAICYGIINRLGGEISVNSTPEAGTTFRIRIPLSGAAGDEKMPVETTLPPEAEWEAGIRPREGELARTPTAVLVVDDESAFVETMAKRLVKRNLVVFKAFSGEEALQRLAENRNVDVVIMDVKMSGMDGLETLREIQKGGFLAEVILLSGHTTVESAIEGIKRGAFDYLMKPCDMVQLFSQIEKAKAKKTRKEQSLMEDRIRDITRRM